jgi:hypothetical protein
VKCGNGQKLSYCVENVEDEKNLQTSTGNKEKNMNENVSEKNRATANVTLYTFCAID